MLLCFPRKSFIAPVFSFLAATSAFAGPVDLTPHTETRVFNGVVSRRTYFTDGAVKFGVHTDRDADVSPSEGGATFRFKQIPQASVQLRTSPLPAKTGFTPEALARYRDAALGLIPPGAEEVSQEQVLEPLPINDWHSCRFIISYRTPMGLMRESFTFVNITGDQQILLRAGARQQDWDGVAARADKLISRWHVILPSEERSET